MSALAYKIAQNLPQGLSAEIADNFRSAGIELSGKKRNMNVFLSILLAESIKTAHKKSNLFQNRLFTDFRVKCEILSH
jgi:hypothetical protein